MELYSFLESFSKSN